MKSKNLTTREWILIIMMLSLLQGIIWYASFVNANNGTALNYISFAGTLISIILAVLAIGYTYGESISEKNKSNVIANQIETLNEVLNNLVIQNSNLEIISKINDGLLLLSDSFNEGISNTSKKVDDLKSSFENAFEKPNFGKELDIPNAKDILTEILSKSKSYPIQIAILILFYFHKTKLPVNKIVTNTKDFFDEATKIGEEKDIQKVSQSMYVAATGIILQLLIQVNLIEQIDHKITFDETLLNMTEHLLSYLPKNRDSFNAIIYELMVEKIKAVEN